MPYDNVQRFERTVVKTGYILTLFFLTATLPMFIGFPALVGVVMSYGLVIYGKLRVKETEILINKDKNNL